MDSSLLLILLSFLISLSNAGDKSVIQLDYSGYATSAEEVFIKLMRKYEIQQRVKRDYPVVLRFIDKNFEKELVLFMSRDLWTFKVAPKGYSFSEEYCGASALFLFSAVIRWFKDLYEGMDL